MLLKTLFLLNFLKKMYFNVSSFCEVQNEAILRTRDCFFVAV